MKSALTLFGIGLIALIVGSLWFWSEISFLFDNPFDNRTFSESIWKANDHDWNHDNPRGEMVDDLKRQLFQEKPNQTIILQQLGEPDYLMSDTLYSYNIGAWSGFGIDYDSLDINFDDAGNFIDVQVLQH